MTDADADLRPAPKKIQHPFRRAVFRGLAIVMPPLLTVILFLWAWNIIDSNILRPMETVAHTVIRWAVADVADKVPDGVTPQPYKASDGRTLDSFAHDGKEYVKLAEGQWVLKYHYDEFVRLRTRGDVPLTDATRFYQRYAQLKCPRRMSLPIFLAVFVLLLYFCGKFMAFSAGRMMWNAAERIVIRLPIIRNVYSSVKQVTDLFFGEHEEVRFTRVVAVEYPRKGIWALAFVTGESFLDLRAAANEPVLALLVPTSPMPATGFTVTVRKTETIDVNITMDQAIQFIVSCGVVSPPYSWPEDRQKISAHIADAVARHQAGVGNGDSTKNLPASDTKTAP